MRGAYNYCLNRGLTRIKGLRGLLPRFIGIQSNLNQDFLD